MSIKQGDMTASQYFTKVKSLCDEIQKVDAESAINEAKSELLLEAWILSILALSRQLLVGQLNLL